MGIQNRGIGVGPVQVKVNLGVCGGFNETFDSYTGLESLSVIEIRELPPREYNSVCVSLRPT